MELKKKLVSILALIFTTFSIHESSASLHSIAVKKIKRKRCEDHLEMVSHCNSDEELEFDCEENCIDKIKDNTETNKRRRVDKSEYEDWFYGNLEDDFVVSEDEDRFYRNSEDNFVASEDVDQRVEALECEFRSRFSLRRSPLDPDNLYPNAPIQPPLTVCYSPVCSPTIHTPVPRHAEYTDENYVPSPQHLEEHCNANDGLHLSRSNRSVELPEHIKLLCELRGVTPLCYMSASSKEERSIIEQELISGQLNFTTEGK
ncbi:MAG: hypothetical protein LBP39_03030 [Rickettsiales bacterium]|jgi:hypothetical protein|nr:hypothetical protein [Rickettsiales bacterium]